MDQAQSLREYMNRFNESHETNHSSRMITITSGKGGVGKSNFTLNFALALRETGKKVIILDLDLSTANINILMGLNPRFTLADVLHQRKSMLEILEKGTGGIEYLLCGFELEELLKFDQNMLLFFWKQLQVLQSYADYILLDTGAGISKENIDFIMASDETILVTTPEPTAIADSYAVLKAVHQSTKQPPNFRLVVNRAHTYQEAVETSRALKNAANKFLKMKLMTLGFLMEDPYVQKAVRMQTPFYLAYPKCEATRSIKQILYSYTPEWGQTHQAPLKGIKGFFEKILSLGKMT
ncbi:MinD/ParA family protein [Neobacillus sp.]|jgi:flagellar biosynthesis protein FlhG|uniref:MinD/ParA family protein n=1 Tax=Neobacillus sp. TaxID=2675273 RepID=UPI0035B5663F